MTETWIAPPPETIALPVAGTNARFAIRRIYCVGRNYADHIKELGNARPDAPFYFAKQRDELVPGGGRISYPPATSDYQYEVELVAAIGKGGADIAEKDALGHVFGYAVGLDMTRRDLQRQFQEKRLPWTMAKSFDQSAPCGTLTPVHQVEEIGKAPIHLTVNGEVRQKSDLSNLIWSVAALIADLSRKVQLEAGDLLFTGTPAGVGPVAPGDKLSGHIEGLETLKVEIVA